MSTNQIRAMVRTRLRSGALPHGRGQEVFGRRGGTGVCGCCGAAIGPREVEYEVHFSSGRVLLTHLDCYRIWREESMSPAPP